MTTPKPQSKNMRLTPQQSRRLETAPVARLATAGSNAAPHIIPVCFALDNDSDTEGCHIYSVLDQKPKRAALTRLRRVRNLLENPQAALLVDHYNPADWSQLWYILITGPAELLTADHAAAQPERQRAIAQLRQKYPQYRTMDIAENPVIRLTAARVVEWDAG